MYDENDPFQIPRPDETSEFQFPAVCLTAEQNREIAVIHWDLEHTQIDRLALADRLVQVMYSANEDVEA